jgi:hypothetical protein
MARPPPFPASSARRIPPSAQGAGSSVGTHSRIGARASRDFSRAEGDVEGNDDGLPIPTALLQCRAIASHTSNILPGSRAQFHRAETTRQAVYAETRRCRSFQTAFGNSGRSGSPAMRAAKRNGPTVQGVHRLSVIAAHDKICAASAECHLYRSLCRIAPLFTEGRQRGDGRAWGKAVSEALAHPTPGRQNPHAACAVRRPQPRGKWC